MTRPVERGRFHRSCDCGFTGTYETAGIADKALKRHSCAKHRADAEKSARYLARMAAVDRTPKTCQHKYANHQHGTAVMYKLDFCRCLPCSTARGAETSERLRQQAYGRYDRYVDAEPVREHLRGLMERGMGRRQITAQAQTSDGTMAKLFGYGKREPSKRITRDLAERLLAVRFALADGQRVSGLGTARRLQALVALGYSQAYLAGRLDMTASNFTPLAHGRRGVLVGTANRVRDLYDELSMKVPPANTRRERQSVSRARNFAKAHGWPPPLSWDDERIDDPDYHPRKWSGGKRGLDHAVVQRFLDGREKPGRKFSHEEAAEIVRRLRLEGMTEGAIERLGFKPERYPKSGKDTKEGAA